MDEGTQRLIHVLPRFSSITPSRIESELNTILAKNRESISILASIESASWENFIYPMECLANNLDRYWAPIRHINSVMNSPEHRDVYNDGLKLISEYSTELGQNSALFKQYQTIKESKNYALLEQGQQKSIDDSLRAFRLSGVSLDTDEKIRFKEITLRLSEITTKFSENVLDSDNAWGKHIRNESELQGLLPSALSAAKERAMSKDLDGWYLNLEFPTYYAVQTYSENRQLRQELYSAYTTRASNAGPHDAKYNNDALMTEILMLRAEKAQLLGFAHFAELSVESKMVDSAAQVNGFLNELLEKSKPLASAEFEQLRIYARQKGLSDVIQAWDLAFYSNKLKQELYAIADEDLKPYFPANVVISGLFQVVNKLFGISIEKLEGIDVWHKDADFYQILDSNNTVRGGFYLDTYARENKRGGAWMDECVCRMQTEDFLQLPVAYLTCSLTPPLEGQPALLTHNEVTTLFHEFGHGLQHMLTQVDYRDVSGINGVEWDAVELPSQFLENWCWDKEAVQFISSHFETHKNIPIDLLEKAQKAKNFQSAMQMLRQLEFALFDMKIHMEARSDSPLDIQVVLDHIRNEVSVVPVPDINKFQNGFSHIFAGGYAAGYFSYKWAEVLSADAFSLFEEKGIFDTDTGAAFMQKILEKGGTEKALDLFVQFRGREPQIDALLRHSGLA